MENLHLLINALCKQPSETTWLEFKENNCDPEMIGADISALANSAALAEKSHAYMIWGVNDVTHEIVGTQFCPQTAKKGNQELENWLRGLLSPNADFEFHGIQIDNKAVVVLIICRAVNQSVKFKKADYIRVGSCTKKLADHPELQAKLWERLRTTQYEDLLAKTDLTADQSLQLIDWSLYFELKEEPQPTTQEGILHYMLEEGIVVSQDNGLYAISNMGAILFAKNLTNFPSISRKAVRVVQYEGNDRLSMLKEDIGKRGYAVGFVGLLHFIGALLPSKETIRNGLRETTSTYPSLAIRESIANALIHQDFSVTGTGPVVEIFDKRIEITNPGTPLVDVFRIIDNPPKSRNEKLAALMRRLGMCEELGTGWDKIAISCEIYQLPAPKIYVYESNTKVTLFSDAPFSSLSPEEKLWSVYLHACIKQVSGEYVTNSSLRERFGLSDSSSATVSRLIKEAVSEKLIKALDPSTSPKHMKYLPIWA